MNKTIKVPISIGELIDKITILEIKELRIKHKEKLKSIKIELALLNKVFSKIKDIHTRDLKKIISLKTGLFEINLRLWRIEDKIRLLESNKDFGKKFVNLARSIYLMNDKRSMIKNKLNILTESELTEIKYYSKYK